MILNERQYRVTKTKLREFKEKIDTMSTVIDNTDNPIQRACLEGIVSQYEEMREELQEYRDLKKGVSTLKDVELKDLGVALIKARIMRGLTQEELANLLGVKQQQVQRDESNRYYTASLIKLQEIAKALNLKLKFEVVIGESHQV